jgi:hypothetical protein
MATRISNEIFMMLSFERDIGVVLWEEFRVSSIDPHKLTLSAGECFASNRQLRL